MRGSPLGLSRPLQRLVQLPQLPVRGAVKAHRYVHIQAASTTITTSTLNLSSPADAFGVLSTDSDARFEVLGSHNALLSVTLSPSQNLYTRRGTLVGVTGKADNAQSTLSILSPYLRAFLGIPFLYQRISASSPITAVIAPKASNTSFSLLHLDGTRDWVLPQRNALAAWTGRSLHISPKLQTSLALAHWGQTFLTGRGVAALASPGQVYQITLGEGEEFTLHPSHVVAYTLPSNVSRKARPYRFQHSRLRLQVPSLPSSLTNWTDQVEWIQKWRQSSVYAVLARLAHSLRTMSRRVIWGDRLFLQFQGPLTLLVSSRGLRVADSLTNEQVNEIADTPAGALQAALTPPVVSDSTKTQPSVTAVQDVSTVSKPKETTNVVKS